MGLQVVQQAGIEFQVLRDKVDQGKIVKGLASRAEEVEVYSEGSGEPSKDFKQGSNL